MSTDTQDIAVVDISRIDQALIKENVTDKVLAKLKADYAHLDKEIENEEQYGVVHTAQQACKDVRKLAEVICTKGREQALAEQRAWIAKEKEVKAKVAEVEDPLLRRKEEWKQREQRRIDEAAKAFAMKMQQRKDRLFEVGFTWDGKNYVLDNEAGGEWSLAEEDVTGPGVDDLQLGEWLSTVERELKVNRELKAEAEAKAKEEAERVQREKDELAAKAQELLRREAEFAARVVKSRVDALIAVGGVKAADGSTGFGKLMRSKDELASMDDAQFEVFEGEVKAEAVAFKVALEARQKKEAEERAAREEQLKKEAAERAVIAERERAARAEQERIEAEARAKAEQEEKEAKQSDAQKLRTYHAALLAVKVPEMKSKAGVAHLKRIVETLGTLLPAK